MLFLSNTNGRNEEMSTSTSTRESRRYARQMLEYLEQTADEWRVCILAMTPTERQHVKLDVTQFVQYVQGEMEKLKGETTDRIIRLKCAVMVQLHNLNRCY